MRTIALFKNKEGNYNVLYNYTGVDDIRREVRDLDFMGYKMISCVVTNNKVLALKIRLRYCLTELRSLKKDVNYYGYDTILINRIGRLTSKLLRREVEVTDELALQCLDVLNKEREEIRQEELKKELQKAVDTVCLHCAFTEDVCEECPVRKSMMKRGL